MRLFCHQALIIVIDVIVLPVVNVGGHVLDHGIHHVAAYLFT